MISALSSAHNRRRTDEGIKAEARPTFGPSAFRNSPAQALKKRRPMFCAVKTQTWGLGS